MKPMRENLRDYLKPRRTMSEHEEPVIVPSNCQLSMCRCGGYGKPDVVVRTSDGVIHGYACQTGYYDYLERRGLSQMQVAEKQQMQREENERKKKPDLNNHSEV